MSTCRNALLLEASIEPVGTMYFRDERGGSGGCQLDPLMNGEFEGPLIVPRDQKSVIIWDNWPIDAEILIMLIPSFIDISIEQLKRPGNMSLKYPGNMQMEQ